MNASSKQAVRNGNKSFEAAYIIKTRQFSSNQSLIFMQAERNRKKKRWIWCSCMKYVLFTRLVRFRVEGESYHNWQIPQPLGHFLSLTSDFIEGYNKWPTDNGNSFRNKKPNMWNCNMRGDKLPSKAFQLSARTTHFEDTSILLCNESGEHQLAII